MRQALSAIIQGYWLPLLLILFGFAIVLRGLRSRRAFIPAWAVSDEWKREYADQYNIAAIRRLIEAAFTADGLKEFCQDRSAFRPVLKCVPARPSLADLAEALIEYCQTGILFDQLLDDIHTVNPRQYEQHRAKLYALDETTGGDTPLSWQNIPVLPRLLRYGAIGIGCALLAVGLAWIMLTSVSLAPPTSLISLTYRSDGWNPCMVDLRTASSTGIPASSGQSLEVYDLWIAVPRDAPEYKVKAEIYANNQRIGSIASTALIVDSAYPGVKKLEAVSLESFQHASVPGAWLVQPDWKDLDVVLITERSGKAVASVTTTIHLDGNGEAWFIRPPNAHFISIVYSINDGPELVLDLRDAGEAGLGLKPGDKLKLWKVWYHANLAGSEHTIHVEARLGDKEYDPSTLQVSEPDVIQKGIHRLGNFLPLEWTIPADKEALVLSLVRSDGAIMDRFIPPLGRQGSSGMVSRFDYPAASLISLSFKAHGYVDPRLVDLRTAATSGIPVQAGQALQLLDLWAWVPSGAPGDAMQVEVYANGQQIGYTTGTHLVAGAVQLGAVTVSAFQDDADPKGWSVQADWSDLMVFLVTYDQGRKLGLTHTKIRLNPQGTAWLVDPPNLSFASIVYSINNGPPLVWDLRSGGQGGPGARQGDTLTVLEVWYRSNANSTEYEVMVEGYLSSTTDASSQHEYTTPSAIQWGVNHLPEISNLSWVLAGDEEALVLSLWRMGPDHNVVMDGVRVHFSSQGSPGLVSASGAILDYQYSTFLDFEDDVDLEDWSGKVSRSTEYAFAGDYSLQASFVVPETSEGEDLAAWEREFTADVILAHYYLPEASNVHVRWMLFCIPLGEWACTDSLKLEQGVWHTAVLDLSKTQYRGKRFSEVNLPSLVIRGAITTSVVTEPVSYNIYVDNLRILEDGEH